MKQSLQVNEQPPKYKGITQRRKVDGRVEYTLSSHAMLPVLLESMVRVIVTLLLFFFFSPVKCFMFFFFFTINHACCTLSH